MANEQTTQVGGVGLPKGSKVGKYQVVERLGMGGQAVVYKAYDPLLDRFVALKQVSTHLAADEKFVERFRREAQILAKLGGEQESIVTIHELIEEERGLFIVMEYLAGHSLETVLEDTPGPSEPKAVLQIIWRLAAALHAVHNAGVIHRDLKPSNIIICEGLRAKITDFGVAASITGQTSMKLGTTKYMAPELFEGGPVDGRADMYSLGFIAYELLAGRPKFNEIFADIIRDKHSEALRWMKWHGNTSVQTPLLTEISPSVPPLLSQVVARMMEKDVEKRFQSMEELGRALKTAFSPRAKARPPARRRVVRPQPVAVGALTAQDSGAPLVPRDEGDELEVAPDAATTAALPSTRLGRKVLLFFVLPVVVLLILGGATAGLIEIAKQRRIRREQAQIASKTYSEAVTTLKKEALISYDRAKFEKAAQGFTDVRTRFPRTDYAVKASVLLPLCQAYLAMADGEWEQAKLKQDETAKQVKWVQSKYASLVAWSREAKQYERSFDSYYTLTRSFREAMVKARQQLRERHYDEARLIIQRDLLRAVSPTPQQHELIQKFLKEVDLTELREQLAARIQKGDDLAQQSLAQAGKFIEAEEAYTQAQELLQGERASILPADEAKAEGQKIAAKLKALTENRTLREHMAAVDKARASGDKNLLLIALRGLDRIQPSDQIKEEMQTIQAEVALAKGREYIAAGKMAEGRRMLLVAMKFKPLPEAKIELAKLDRADERAGLISAGDALFVSNKWPEALAQYEKAAKLQMSDDLAIKVVECRFRIGLEAADKLRDDGKYDEAARAYMALRTIKPAAAALVDARLAAMEANRRYEKFIADGDDAMKREQWPQARAFYEGAQKIRNTVEVKAKITETRYQENKARGLEAMERRDYNGALGYLKLAKGFKDTQEIRDLIAQAEKKLKEGGSG